MGGGDLDFAILGPLEVRHGGEPVALGGTKQRALLARLLLQPGEPVSVDRLIEDLWDDDAPAGAAHALQVYVSSLRKVLGKEVVQHRAGGYVAAVDAGQVDAHRFEQLRSDAGSQEPREAQRLLREALALWRGPALADFQYESFAQAPIARLEEERLAAIEDRIDADLALGHGSDLVAELQKLVAEHRLRERLRAQLMLALYRAGRQSDALAEYQAARSTLVDELGIDPSPQLQELHGKILNQDESLLAQPPKPPQLRLPVALTPLVGRERELEELEELLRGPAARLVTLTGPGGTGKTRLALALAQRVGPRFADGAVFVGLASISRAGLVRDAIEQEVCDGTALEEHVRNRRLLLVLDNFEHVADAADVVAGLLDDAPGLAVVITSRVSLHLSREIEYPVPPLVEGEAVELFARRAEAGGSAVSANGAVAEICRRLDCLPLAVELAAARAKLLPPDALLKRLEQRLPLLAAGPRDAPERHRTLRATIDWSHALLEEEERRVFAAFSIFVGGCTLEAAEEVCEADLDTLASLVDKSLVRAGGGRFRMLETIREFASERLSERRELERVARRHAEHFARFMSDAEFDGGDQAETLAAVRREEWNVRTALRWAIDHGDATLALTLAAKIGRYWFLREYFAGRSLLEEAVALEGGDDAARATVLLRVGELAGYAGERDRAVEALEECIAIRRRLGDRRGIAIGLNGLGIVYAMGERDDLLRAREVMSERLAISREVGDEVGVASALCNLGSIEGLLGASERARPLLEEALSIAERHGQDYGRAMVSTSLGAVLVDLGETELAWQRLREALLVLQQLDLRGGATPTLEEIAALAVTAGDVAAAGRLLGAVEAARSDSGGVAGPGGVERVERTRARAVADREAFEQGFAEGLALPIETAFDEALALASAPVRVSSGV